VAERTQRSLPIDEATVDAFAGGGGASTGIEQAYAEMGLDEVVDIAVNHDEDALAMHAANHPRTLHLREDVFKVDIRRRVGKRLVRLLWLSPDCFPAGTLVLTGRGYMPIEQIQVGDAVLTHKGRWRHVTEVSSTQRQLMTVKGHGHPGLRVSPEHPFYTRTHQRSEPYWLRASGLERGDYWATPTQFPKCTPAPVPGRGMSADARLMWLAGRYLGDGWSRITEQRAEVVITCGKHECDKLRETLSKWPRAGLRAGADELAWSERPTRTAYQFATNHRGLVQWLREHFGHRAESKTVPAWALGMAPELRQALLDGYLSADGHRTARFVECRTVSKALAFGVKALAASLGHTVTVYTGTNTDRIEGRAVQARDYYLLRWRHAVDEAHRQTFRAGCLEWAPIREVTEPGIGQQRVYNIGVAEDESYVVEGVVVHNCKHFSKAKGGKPVEKRIRGLAWVGVKWAKILKPRVIALENVEEFQSWGPLIKTGDGWYPDPARKGQTFNRFIAQLRALGYRIEWRELRACDYGAPTIRKRLFVIARRDKAPIVWPKATHGKGTGQAYRTAAECIDWSIPCPSIFERKKPLAEATLRRIARGIQRYVIDAAEAFIVPVLHGAGDLRTHGLDEPLRTITGAHRGDRALVVPHITKYHGESAGSGIDAPMPTVTSNSFHKRPGGNPPLALVEAQIAPFITEHANASNQRNMPADEPMRTQCAQVKGGHFALAGATLVHVGNGERAGQAPRAMDIEKPLGTVVAQGVKQHLVTAFLAQHNKEHPPHVKPGRSVELPLSTVVGSGSQQSVVTSHLLKLKGTCKEGQPVDQPAPTVQAGGWHIGEVRAFLVKYFSTAVGQALDEPAATLTSKPRLGLVYVRGEAYQIVDIGMRMLTARELARAQGFPDSYVIDRGADGKPLTKSAQVRMIGNSVCPPLAKAIVLAQFAAEAALVKPRRKAA
jgi:site-specific DNA-cytosine methylase